MKNIHFGIDIGGTKIAIGAFDDNRALTLKKVLATDQSFSPEELCDHIAKTINEMLTALDAPIISGIGIGCPSFVNYDTGYIYKTTNIANLRDFNIVKYFLKYFNVPIFVDNDANLAALAEYKLGAGRGSKNMVYSTASTGIGGGLILNGNVYRGSNGFAGETGHSIATPNKGVSCGCGNIGCFESYAGGANIYKHVLSRIDAGESTIMTDIAGSVENITGKTLAAAYESGDKMAAEIFDQIAFNLGILFFNLTVILDIDRIVVGGGLVNLGDSLIQNIRKTYSSFKRPYGPQAEIVKAALMQDFGIIGAALLVK